MNGFFVRVAAQIDKAARDVSKAATEVEASGLEDEARMLRQIADHLAALARVAAATRGGTAIYTRIADDTDAAHRAVSQSALQLRIALLLKPSFALERVASVLISINRDAAVATQPLDPRYARKP